MKPAALDERALPTNAWSPTRVGGTAVKVFRGSSRRDPKSFDARRPHPFIEGGEHATAGIAAGYLGGGGAAGVMDVAGTAHVMRTSGCVVPGCGKPTADEVHIPVEP